MNHCPYHESERAPQGQFDAVDRSPQPPGDRREFLKAMGTMSVGLAMAHLGTEPAAAAERPRCRKLPFGKVRLSRLICGANPFNAGSHLSTFVNQEMRSYYTPEQILKTLRRCEAGRHQLLADFRGAQPGSVSAAGRRRQPDARDLAGPRSGRLPALAKGGCLGVAHHGEVTDQLFKTGKLDEVHDFLKRVRDAGMLAGVSTHMPAVVDAIESKGWELGLLHDVRLRAEPQQRGAEEAAGLRAPAAARSLPGGRPAAHVPGRAQTNRDLPGVQDPGGRPPLRPQGPGRTGFPRDVPGHQAAPTP